MFWINCPFHTQFRYQLVFFIHIYGWLNVAIGIFFLGNICWWHLLPRQKMPSASFDWRHDFTNTTPRSYHMRCEHFPLFTHGIIRAQSECPASSQAGVSTASGSAIGFTYTKGLDTRTRVVSMETLKVCIWNSQLCVGEIKTF